MIDVKKCFIVVVCVMLITPIFGDDPKTNTTSGCPCKAAIDDAMRGTPQNTKSGDDGKIIPLDPKDPSRSDSVVSSLNKIFVLAPKTKAEDSGQSILDGKIDLYEKYFYTWYGKEAIQNIKATADLFGKSVAANRLTQNNTIINSSNQNTAIDSPAVDREKEEVLKNLKQIDDDVKQEVDGYIRTTIDQTPKSIFEATDETAKLFTTIPKKKPTTTKEEDTEATKAAKEANKKAQALKLSALNPLPLLTQGNKKDDIDKLITTFKNTLPPLKVVYLPPIEPKMPDSVEIIVPIIEEKGEYHKEKVATNTYTGYSEGIKRILGVKEKIEKNPLYQEYVLKNLSNLMIRDSLLNNIFYVLKSREKKIIKGGEQLSLAEKERQMALEGLDPAYYKTLTVAALNLKTLHTNNKMLYFMYKISQQIEYANFIQSIRGLQDQRSSLLQDDTSITEIAEIIKEIIKETP